MSKPKTATNPNLIPEKDRLSLQLVDSSEMLPREIPEHCQLRNALEIHSKKRVSQIEVTTKWIHNQWLIPTNVQRNYTPNPKIAAEVTASILADQCLPGTITIAVLNGVQYLVDGRHRVSLAFACGIMSLVVTVTYVHVSSVAEMAEQFSELNGTIARMTTNHILHAKVESHPALAVLKRSGAIDFSQVRRSLTGPVLLMSSALFAWEGSSFTPPRADVSQTAVNIGALLTLQEAKDFARFLHIARKAWPDPRGITGRLWAPLNLTLCLWLYRRLVLQQNQDEELSWPVLSDEEFEAQLAKLFVGSKATKYLDELNGRPLDDWTRREIYNNIVTVFGTLPKRPGVRAARLPLPSWSPRQVKDGKKDYR